MKKHVTEEKRVSNIYTLSKRSEERRKGKNPKSSKEEP